MSYIYCYVPLTAENNYCQCFLLCQLGYRVIVRVLKGAKLNNVLTFICVTQAGQRLLMNVTEQSRLKKTNSCPVQEFHESSESCSKEQHCYMFMLFIGYLITPSLSDTINSLLLCLRKFKFLFFFFLGISQGV